jgi:hypothetical protein
MSMPLPRILSRQSRLRMTPADHVLDGVAEEPACRSGIAEFAGPLQIFPGDLEGIL